MTKVLVKKILLLAFMLGMMSLADAQEFITTWKTDNPGTSGDNEITIPTIGTGYDYTVNWGDGNSDMNVTGDITHTYASAGTYTVTISGDFPRIYFDNTGDKDKILTVEQWGDIAWVSMFKAFFGCTNLTIPATDAPDLSGVTSMSFMFYAARSLNEDISHWDVSNITDMSYLFGEADIFNQDISGWDVSNVTNMLSMFPLTHAFNQDLSGWDVSNVVNMRTMFNGASAFNQDISSWNVSNVTNMFGMFNSSAFDQDISSWDVSGVLQMGNMFSFGSLSKQNYDKILLGWSQLTLQADVELGVSGVTYCNGADARQAIIDNFNWTITDGGESCQAFITTWQTTTTDELIAIPTTGTGYNFDVDWGDGSSNTDLDEGINHSYTDPGVYTVTITGDFPRIHFNNTGDKDKILTIEQWGDIAWSSMDAAFYGCSNLNITAADAPNLSGVTSLRDMFNSASTLNADLNHWDVSNVTSLHQTFARASSFDGDIGSWDVSNVSTMFGTFFLTPFNQDISGWDVSNVTNMSVMFRQNPEFNQDISGWNVSNVVDFQVMFQEAFAFNQDISGWDVSNGVNFSSMFKNADSFNQPIGSWDMSSATAIREMFMQNNAFNQPLDSWDVSGVTAFVSIFLQATSFNQDISAWDVSGATNMTNLFNGASAFDQDLGDWDVSNVTNMFGMLNFSGLSKRNYDNTLDGWSQLTLQNDVVLGASGKEYCYGADARQSIIDNFNWDITDGGEVCNAFITTWKTDNTGTSGDNQISIPAQGSGYDFDIDWGDGNSDANVIGDITHTYASAGTYTVSITGDFPRIFFTNGGDKDKILTIEQWGDIRWETMDESFFGCTNLTIPATDAPDLSGVTSLRRMFLFASSMNDPIGHWDVSTITTMEGMFAGADIFNQDIGNWDVSNVTSFRVMFDDADAFNQDISGWNTSNVTNMETTFRKAYAFNQDISAWDVSNVTDMSSMFLAATSFNQPIGSWDVSSVIDLSNLFRAATAFDQDLNSWDVSSATTASGIFFGAASFNGNISDWDVSGMNDMTSFFNQAGSFNQDITGWDVSSATTMSSMFNSASSFNQDLSGWDVSSVANMTALFNNSDLSKSNYDKILNGWSQLALQSDVTLGGIGVQYCNGAAARQSIIDNFNWTFGDAGENCRAFITTWKTDNAGTSDDNQITIPTEGTGYSYDVDWGDGSSDTGVSGDITHTYTAAGTYTVSISGDFPRIYFNNSGDKEKILTIEQWGDIQWSSMRSAFFGCTHLIYNAIDAPDLSEVTDMFAMFFEASSFNGEIGNWDVSNVTNMQSLFGKASSFDQELGNWDVSSVTNMTAVFFGTPFNRDISDWDVSNVTTMAGMFRNTSAFNQDISSWDVSNVTSLETTFSDAVAFNQDIGNWNTSGVTNMNSTFSGATVFNQDISSWDVSNVTNMEGMFFNARAFNQDISTWDVSTVANMRSMFNGALVFDQPIGSWDVSMVTNMLGMFNGAFAFNQDLSNWDVSSVTDMGVMFRFAHRFNNPSIKNWDVSNVTNMNAMFQSSTDFNQSLENWDVGNVTDMTNMFPASLSKASYDRTLKGWSQLTLQSNVTLGAPGVEYCNGATARQSIIDNFNWTIIDGGEVCNPFITTWKTDNTGTSDDNQITIPTEGSGYNYTVDWGDGTSDTGVTGDITHTYASAGTYTVSITGDFPRIYFNNEGDKEKILTVEQWGDIAWTSMERAFSNCSNLTSTATDAPDLSNVTSTLAMFIGATSFNAPIGHWDVSNVEDFRNMFFSAFVFNQDIGDWDMSSATQLNGMFSQAYIFNQDISRWDVSNVTTMFATFNQALEFNQDLSAWDISSATGLDNLFVNTSLSRENYDKMLIEWSKLDLQNDVTLGVPAVEHCRGTTARQSIIDNFNWTINDGGENCVLDIPDTNFKAALLANTSINTTDDGEITIQEAEVVNNLQLNSLEIADLTGIEAFTALNVLSANSNQLTSIDLSENTELDFLALFGNDLSEIDLSNNPMLTEVNLRLNNLTSIDLSNNASITRLFVHDNAIDAIDVSHLADLQILVVSNNMLTSLDVSNNTLLQRLEPFGNELSALDVSANTALTKLVLSATNISSLDLSANTDLEEFTMSSTPITSLDLSANGALTRVVMLNNDQLTSLDLRNSNNEEITDINLTGNSALSCVSVDDRILARNNWTVDDIDVFKFSCDGDEIVNIPDANFKAALLANTEINTIDDGEITVGEAEAFAGTISAPSAGINSIIGIEYFSNITGITLSVNNLTLADFSNNSKLENVFVNNNAITFLDIDQCPNLVDLRVYNNANLGNLDLSNNPALEVLWVRQTGLTTLDISANPLINDIWAANNSLSVLDVSHLENLERLLVESNDLTSLDLSNNPLLTHIRVFNNDLTELDLRNGANELIETFTSTGTPNLSCISVDNPAYSTANWTDIDDASSFNVSCDPDEAVDIPDANFKAALLANTSINTTDDGEITYGEAEVVNNLVLSGLDISDLTGIGAFTALRTLTVSNNNLTSLDLRNSGDFQNLQALNNQLTSLNLSGLSAITSINVSNNELDEIDVSDQTALINLFVSNNNLSTIDVSSNESLELLSVPLNSITSIDVSMLGVLETLFVQANNLASIDLSGNTNLESLDIGSNSLTALDVSNNPLLGTLSADDNAITSLNLDANTALTRLEVQNNPSLSSLSVKNGNNAAITLFNTSSNPMLTCISVDDVAFASANFTNIDEEASFSTDCSNVETDILAFTLAEQNSAANIDATNHLVEVEVTAGTDLMSIVPTFTISNGATSSPASGEVVDFTDEVIIMVTAQNPSVSQEWMVIVTEENVAPTDISISETSIDENNAVGDVIGTFTTTDANSGDSHTYTLVSGDGDTDNTSFSIDGDALEAAEIFDFETKTSYSIRVETNDGNGGTFQKTFTITINDVDENVAPTDISLSETSIDENNAVGDVIGSFTTTDVNNGDDHTYTLVNGNGDADNASFMIDGDALEAAEAFDFETKSSYSIRVETNDGNGGIFQKAFTITINDVDENVAPTDISLTETSIDENNAVGDVIGSFTTTDANVGDIHTYTLVSGDGDTDNASVTIDGDALEAAEAFDFETKSSYSIRVETNDGNGGTFQKAFTITINDVDENVAPEVSGAIADQSEVEGFENSTISLASVFTDANGDALTYIASSSDENVVTVAVNNSILTITEAGLGTSTITVTADDGNGGTATDEFVVTVIEAPLGLEEAINLKVYPNPVVELLHIESDEDLTVQLSDLNGRRLKIESGRSIRLNMATFSRGIYLLTIQKGEEQTSKRIIKAN